MHCDKVGAAVVVLVLVLVDTVYVGGERFVGGVVGAAGAVEECINFIRSCYHNDAMPLA
jgi:hypothetical protein